MLRSFGFRSKEGGKNFEAIQPRYVFRLDVDGKSEEELQAVWDNYDNEFRRGRDVLFWEDVNEGCRGLLNHILGK